MTEAHGTTRDADFTAFVVANSGRMVHLAELLTGDAHSARDLVQSSLERAYVRWNRIRSDDPLVYVRRIMVNQQRDWWRRRHRREWLTDAVPETPEPGTPTDAYDQRAMVLDALRTLTRRERAVVVLRYYADLREQEIASELGIAPGTVKSTLSRASGKLRTCLAPVPAVS